MDKNKLIIDEYAAEVVRRIFSMYISGIGKNSIAAALNKEGIVCPSEYKKMNGENYRNSHKLESTSYWTYSTINRVLQNEMYVGNMVQGRKAQRMRGKQQAVEKENWIIVKGTHEAIIDEDTWNKSQALLKHRTRKLDLNNNMTIFAGFIKCGDCGRSLVRKNNICYCGAYVRSGRQYCTPHPMPCSVLEKIVLEDLRMVIQSVDDIKELVRQNQSEAAEAAKFKYRMLCNKKEKMNLELAKIRKLKKAVYENYCEELISREEYITYRQDYLKREERLTKQLAGLKEKENLETRENFSAEEDFGAEQKSNKITNVIFETPWIKYLLEFDSIEKLDRDIVVEMINEIKVYENHKIEITYNFSDELAALFKNQVNF